MYEEDADDPVNEAYDLRELDPINADREAYLEERHRQIRLLILRRRKIRDTYDPYDVTFATFTKSYRLCQDAVFSLIRLIRPFVRRTASALVVPLELKILSVLSFYATGTYQTPTGRQLDFAVSQPTMSTFIEEITNALNEDAVLSQLIRFPENQVEVNSCIIRNRALGGKLPFVVGYTDGTLIKIKSPSLANNKAAFIGRKGFPCMNAMITCDRRLYIMNVNARFPGSAPDQSVFSMSALSRRMRQLYQDQRCHLLGDSGYALCPWMIVPFARDDRPQEEDSPEARFNKAHAFDRNCVERAIGHVKEMFRALNDERVLHYEYPKVCNIANAVVVVHNLAVLTNPHYIDPALVFPGDGDGDEDEDEDGDGDDLQQGRNIRAVIVRELEEDQ